MDTLRQIKCSVYELGIESVLFVEVSVFQRSRLEGVVCGGTPIPGIWCGSNVEHVHVYIAFSLPSDIYCGRHTNIHGAGMVTTLALL